MNVLKFPNQFKQDPNQLDKYDLNFICMNKEWYLIVEVMLIID